MKEKGLSSPHSGGIVIRILTIKSKKPNSAISIRISIRKIAKVKIKVKIKNKQRQKKEDRGGEK
jgi:ribosomal protein S12